MKTLLLAIAVLWALGGQAMAAVPYTPSSPIATSVVNASDKTSVSVGSGAQSNESGAIIVHRTAINPLSLSGDHAFVDETTYSPATGTNGGYAAYDCIPTIGGLASSYNHTRCFQARPVINYQGTIPEVSALEGGIVVNSGATISTVYGITLNDAAGAGVVTAQVTVGCQALAFGSSNYCLYNYGSNPLYLGTGRTQIGTGGTLQFPSNFSSYGCILSHDASGVTLDNPFFCIVNGVLTMSYTTAEVLASRSGVSLLLASTDAGVTISPGNGVTTINSLPTATGSYVCSSSGALSVEATACPASDRGLKNPIGILAPKSAAMALDRLDGEVYTYKDTHQYGSQAHVGEYAQDVCALDERLCSRDQSGKIQNYDERGLIAYLIAARHADAARIAALEARLGDAATWRRQHGHHRY